MNTDNLFNINTLKNILYSYGSLLTLLIIVIIFSTLSETFLEFNNIINILRQTSLLTVAALGFTMALIGGELDLSFAYVISLSSVIIAGLMFAGVPIVLSLLAGVGVGAVFGLLNAFFITQIGIESLIVTLASGTIASGLAYMYTGGVAYYGQLPEVFTVIGRGRVGPIPNLVIITLSLVFLSYFFIRWTKYGHHLKATGENPTAARLAGINVNRYKALGLLLSGLGAGLTAVLLTAKLSSAHPSGGNGFLMQGIAAALLGTTMFTPGRANVLGTFFGAIILGVIGNGLTLVGSVYYLQEIVQGAIILVAVSVASYQSLQNE